MGHGTWHPNRGQSTIHYAAHASPPREIAFKRAPDPAAAQPTSQFLGAVSSHDRAINGNGNGNQPFGSADDLHVVGGRGAARYDHAAFRAITYGALLETSARPLVGLR